MTDTENPQADKPVEEPAPGLYIFYDDAKEVQIGVSGDYSIAEAALMLGTAKAKLELLQFHAIRSEHQARQQQQQQRSNIIIPQ